MIQLIILMSSKALCQDCDNQSTLIWDFYESKNEISRATAITQHEYATEDFKRDKLAEATDEPNSTPVKMTTEQFTSSSESSTTSEQSSTINEFTTTDERSTAEENSTTEGISTTGEATTEETTTETPTSGMLDTQALHYFS